MTREFKRPPPRYLPDPELPRLDLPPPPEPSDDSRAFASACRLFLLAAALFFLWCIYDASQHPLRRLNNAFIYDTTNHQTEGLLP